MIFTSRRRRRGWTIVEALIIVAVLGALLAIIAPAILRHLRDAQMLEAVGAIRAIEADVIAHETDLGVLPDTLDEVGRGATKDPWGNPYQYLAFQGKGWQGKVRKDRFLVPINSAFDLYSMGPDGKSAPPLTSKWSHDDIIRANDGDYVGVASEY